jgi:hypothetical protein
MVSIPLHKLDLSFLRKDKDARPQVGSYRWSSVAQKFVALDEWHRLHPHPSRGKSSSLARPLVIGSMAPVKSPIDGQMYDSKSAYYRHVERAGCAIVGFDKNWEEQIKAPVYDGRRHEADIVADIKKSIEQVNTHGGVPNGR